MTIPPFKYWKAVGGFIAGGIVAYLGATDGGVTSTEWLKILLGALGGAGVVAISPANTHADTGPHPHRGARGATNLRAVVAVVLVVVLVLFLFWLLRGAH